jgi:antitoxin component of RelBE/YafQ-DinJ toxin-antitoxin module
MMRLRTFSKVALIKVRISRRRKAQAQARAKEQGVTLSEAVRRLLHLWIEGKIDITNVNVKAEPDVRVQTIEIERKRLTDAELEALDPDIKAALADDSLTAMLTKT